MSKKSRKEAPRADAPNRKQQRLTRQQQERRRTLWIVFGSILGIVAAILVFGLVQQFWLAPRAPVAVVNSEPITATEYRDRVLFEKYRLEERFGSLASSGTLGDQLQQYIASQLPTTVFETMITDEILRQEAARQGITISDDEVTRVIQAEYGFYPNGTPTPTAGPPTSTPLPTATVGAGTPAPTVGPSPTPVFPTESDFKAQYDRFLANLRQQTGLGEAYVRDNARNQLLYERFRDIAVAAASIPAQSLQVRARQIVLDTEEEAKRVAARLKAGEDFATVALQVSKDTATKDKGGDLGYFAQGAQDPILERAAFSQQANQISDPFQVGGRWIILQVTEPAQLRPISADERSRLEEEAVNRFLNDLQTQQTIERDPNPQAVLPPLVSQAAVRP